MVSKVHKFKLQDPRWLSVGAGGEGRGSAGCTSCISDVGSVWANVKGPIVSRPKLQPPTLSGSRYRCVTDQAKIKQLNFFLNLRKKGYFQSKSIISSQHIFNISAMHWYTLVFLLCQQHICSWHIELTTTNHHSLLAFGHPIKTLGGKM